MAIAFDSLTECLGSYSWSHTCTGTNMGVVVLLKLANVSDIVTSVTYDGVSMTRIYISPFIDNSIRVYLYYLSTTTTGTKTISLSTSEGVYVYAQSASYSGVNKTGNPEVNVTGNSGGTSVTLTGTTLTDKSWGIMGAGTTTYRPNSGTNFTRRYTGFENFSIGDTNGDITPAGSLSMTANFSSTTYYGACMIILKPAITTTGNTAKFLQFF